MKGEEEEKVLGKSNSICKGPEAGEQTETKTKKEGRVAKAKSKARLVEGQTKADVYLYP